MSAVIEETPLGPYKVVNGTYYRPQVPDELVSALERLRLSHTERGMAYVVYGDQSRGHAWPPDLERSYGRLGRSSGQVKVPLLVSGKEAGGPALLDHCIVRLARYPDGHVLWQHPNYQPMYCWARATVSRQSERKTSMYVVAAPFARDLARVEKLATFKYAWMAHEYIMNRLRYEVE